MKRMFYFFIGVITFFLLTNSDVFAEFACDDPGTCSPVSNVDCKLVNNPAPNYCTGTSGSYWNVASCDAWDHENLGLNYFKRYYFRIRKNASTNVCGTTSWAYSHTWSQSSSANTDVLDLSCRTYAGTPPTGCGQGVQPPSGPTPTFGAPGACPDPWGQQNPIPCNIVPCEYKNACACTCTNPPCLPGSCGGGGGPPPTATPTPTPTPFCRLFCPGQEGLIGGLDAQGGGVAENPIQPSPILPTQASGFIRFYGYNGYQCGTFDDGKSPVQLCPGGAGGQGVGNTSTWVYPTPTLNPIRYNMLCGGSTQIYTSIVTEGDRSAAGGGVIGKGQPTLIPTAGPSPTLPLYPPGCYLGGPTPTPDGGIPNVGDQDAGVLREQGGGIQSSANSCSCSVTVGCQTSLQALPSFTGSGCDSNCDFTVSPETPEYTDTITFTTSGTGADGTSTLNYDDNTAPVSGTAGDRTHTYLNSGVYKVALSCPGINQTCTRNVNVYCGPLSWYKLKNASFHKNGALNDPIPASINAFDGDDTTESLVSIGRAGLVTTNGSITTGSGNLSTPNWRTTGYTPNGTFSPTSYADYLIARKSYATVVDGNSNGVIDSNELTENSTNYIVGNYTIDNNSIQSKAPLLLVIRGDLILNTSGSEFNPPDKAITLVVTGTLNIHSHLDTMNGIFIATSVNLAYDVLTTNTPLKIVGNLISQNSVDLKKRIRADGSKPSVFVVNDPKQYLRVLDKMGVRKYTQTELRP